MTEVFAVQKASHIFSTKNIGVLLILAFEILMKRLQITSLVLNNRALVMNEKCKAWLGKHKTASILACQEALTWKSEQDIYRISSDIRQIFFPSKTIPKI